MKALFKKIERILDLYFVPYLINGRKQEEYYYNLRKKYNIPNESTTYRKGESHN